MRNSMRPTRQTILLALFVAIASALHVAESLIPVPIPVPGIKLGLANIVSLAVIVMFNWQSAMLVVLVRIIIAALFGGTFLGVTFALSLSGAVLSTAVMAFVYKWWQPPFSLIGVSIIGAVTHNMVQIIAAALLVSSMDLLWYMPYLVLFAVPMGMITGITLHYFLAKLTRLKLV
ncbi:MAG: Gx transporter family protein [Pelosinus sp.]|nr:Gx transporter family protein [Pelosinus sp.]